MVADRPLPSSAGRPPPLAGVRVIELAQYVTGPYAAMMLADLGADVIKVEGPTGDPFRRFGRPSTEYSTVFANANRGKRSLVLDLKAPEDAATLLRMLASTDVMVCNWRPGVADRLGLGDAALSRANQRLIRIYISGYGQQGPLAEEPAFDLVVQARSGMTRAISRSDEPVLLPGYPLDKLTAVMAVQAVLAALIDRDRCGLGDRIDLAMLDAAGYFNFLDLFSNRVLVDFEPQEARNLHAMAVRPVRASDGWLAIAPVSAGAIRGACRAVGHPDWSDDVLAIPDQVALVTELLGRIETVTRAEPVAVWLERFRHEDVPVSPCLSIDDHLADAQVAHNQLYRVSEWPDIGRVRSARYPAVFASRRAPDGLDAAPALGADTEQLLLDFEAGVS